MMHRNDNVHFFFINLNVKLIFTIFYCFDGIFFCQFPTDPVVYSTDMGNSLMSVIEATTLPNAGNLMSGHNE